MDLHQYNHCVRRFETPAAFEAEREALGTYLGARSIASTEGVDKLMNWLAAETCTDTTGRTADSVFIMHDAWARTAREALQAPSPSPSNPCIDDDEAPVNSWLRVGWLLSDEPNADVKFYDATVTGITNEPDGRKTHILQYKGSPGGSSVWAHDLWDDRREGTHTWFLVTTEMSV